MTWGAAGQCACYLFITAMLKKAADPSSDRSYGMAATFFFFVYYLFFGICWQVGLHS